MKVYHMSQTLAPQDTLLPDHEHLLAYSEPFIQALEHSEDCFFALLLQGKYLYNVFRRSGLTAEWVNYAKWATEAIFEVVRRRSFSDCISRLQCSYFYTDLAEVQRLFVYDWGGDPEGAAQVHVYEMELADEAPSCFDMALYDLAYEAIEQRQDVAAAMDAAHRYFAGQRAQQPVPELLSAQPARVTQDLSALTAGWLRT